MKPNIGQGDKGTTFLFGGKQVSKDECQVQAYGDVDELNSFIGYIRSVNKHQELDSILEKIQEDLFVLGSQLASAVENSKLPQLTKDNVKFLEENILKFEKDLPELRRFILPTGSQIAALLHIARTVCRRAERSIVALSKIKKLNEFSIPYINRLSDLLFTLARYANKKEGKNEKEWISK
ncbi:MAG: cob(I)yrinic acid a,c-diamide adenosyltransferase [Candidatus Aenigmatarchaeota archaeon]|nr:cob(I)yrinic acid a,c-diamide adenosyltransferase [Candidatus Aenigmarchaeota archaeon]